MSIFLLALAAVAGVAVAVPELVSFSFGLIGSVRAGAILLKAAAFG